MHSALLFLKKFDLHIPSDQDVKKLLNTVSDTEMELPILLSAFGPMRKGEICTLHAEDTQGSLKIEENGYAAQFAF